MMVALPSREESPDCIEQGDGV